MQRTYKNTIVRLVFVFFFDVSTKIFQKLYFSITVMYMKGYSFSFTGFIPKEAPGFVTRMCDKWKWELIKIWESKMQALFLSQLGLRAPIRAKYHN
jgi:hypothetical protein